MTKHQGGQDFDIALVTISGGHARLYYPVGMNEIGEATFFIITRKKARFERLRAAREWNLPYSATLRDPVDQSHTLDPP